MQLSIARYKSDEFRKVLIGALQGDKEPIPQRFILKSVYALAADGRDRKLERSFPKPGSMTFTGKFCERETLIGMRLEFGDGTRELLNFTYEVRTQFENRTDTAEVLFSIDF